MFRRIGFIAAWMMVTVVAVAIAAQAVGSVRDQVTDRPSPIVDVGALGTTTSTAGSQTTAPPPIQPPATTTTRAPTTTTTAAGPEPSTTTTTTTEPPTPSTTTTTTTTTAPPPTTTTTTVAPEMTAATYELIGGWVRIRYGNGQVILDGAGANAGYTMDVDESGPTEVEVEFRSEDHRSRFSAEWEDGELEVEIKEEGDEEDHDDA